MIIFFAAQLLTLSSVTPQQAAVGAYQDCLASIVKTNELSGEKNYQPQEVVLARIKAECSKERAAAREALATVVVAQLPDHPAPQTYAEKEELIQDATIRWANNVVARLVAEEE